MSLIKTSMTLLYLQGLHSRQSYGCHSHNHSHNHNHNHNHSGGCSRPNIPPVMPPQPPITPGKETPSLAPAAKPIQMSKEAILITSLVVGFIALSSISLAVGYSLSKMQSEQSSAQKIAPIFRAENLNRAPSYILCMEEDGTWKVIGDENLYKRDLALRKKSELTLPVENDIKEASAIQGETAPEQLSTDADLIARDLLAMLDMQIEEYADDRLAYDDTDLTLFYGSVSENGTYQID